MELPSPRRTTRHRHMQMVEPVIPIVCSFPHKMMAHSSSWEGRMRGILGGEEDREAISQGAGKLGKPRPYYIRDLSANRSIVGAPLAGALARGRPGFSRWQTIFF